MQGKRLTGLALAVLLMLPASALTAGETEAVWTRPEGDGSYVTVRLPYPEGEYLSWEERQALYVRYADTKEPAALSSGYERGDLFATVPGADAGRELEVVRGEPARFADCVAAWGEYEAYNAPTGTGRLSLQGIILGDGSGNLNADAALTRAEAFAILVRLLSLEPDGDPGYADVEPGDWYYDVASAARAAGIAERGSSFDPARPVTRCELTVMLCRAMEAVGWLDETARRGADLGLADEGDIPKWALPAYRILSSHGVEVPLSWIRTGGNVRDGPEYEAWAEPYREAAREDAIGLVGSALRNLPWYPTQAAIEWGFDREMPAIDGSVSTYPCTIAVFAALFRNPANQPRFPDAHSGSEDACERLIRGEADLLFLCAGAALEASARAEAAGVELELIPYCRGADSGGYHYAVVRAGEGPDSPARRMVEFLLSEQGRQCVVNAGFGTLE